jgi:two-component system cell cycle response regulator
MSPEKDMEHIKLLLIEDDPADTELFRDIVSDLRHETIDITCTNRLSSAFKHLEGGKIEVILTDLDLPDSHGLDTVVRINEQFLDVPVIVLSGFDHEDLAIESVKSGAQDYLIKGQIDADRLIRSIRYSIERHRLIQELKSLAITDELTGLYNRRGFLVLAGKQLEMAARVKKLLWLIYLDIDSMKWINDNLGHKQGDDALISMADILKQTFRESDIIARIGGDEFAIVALNEFEPDPYKMVTRIQENIANFNANKGRPYKLSVSTGLVACDSVPDRNINELLSIADRFMYEEKKSKKNTN